MHNTFYGKYYNGTFHASSVYQASHWGGGEGPGDKANLFSTVVLPRQQVINIHVVVILYCCQRRGHFTHWC